MKFNVGQCVKVKADENTERDVAEQINHYGILGQVGRVKGKDLNKEGNVIVLLVHIFTLPESCLEDAE